MARTNRERMAYGEWRMARTNTKPITDGESLRPRDEITTMHFLFRALFVLYAIGYMP